jgi:amino-acid N-acetyltransferase
MAAGAIVELRRGQLAALRALLRENGLPDEDCDDPSLYLCAVFEDGELVAAGGLEPAAPYALLRSVAVRRDRRGQGLARRISSHLLQRAGRDGLDAVYLLTETARDYFAGLGFEAVERADVPAPIAATRQFAALCPQSASCMRLDLRSARRSRKSS